MSRRRPPPGSAAAIAARRLPHAHLPPDLASALDAAIADAVRRLPCLSRSTVRSAEPRPRHGPLVDAAEARIVFWPGLLSPEFARKAWL